VLLGAARVTAECTTIDPSLVVDSQEYEAAKAACYPNGFPAKVLLSQLAAITDHAVVTQRNVRHLRGSAKHRHSQRSMLEDTILPFNGDSCLDFGSGSYVRNFNRLSPALGLPVIVVSASGYLEAGDTYYVASGIYNGNWVLGSGQLRICEDITNQLELDNIDAIARVQGVDGFTAETAFTATWGSVSETNGAPNTFQAVIAAGEGRVVVMHNYGVLSTAAFQSYLFTYSATTTDTYIYTDPEVSALELIIFA
jgi:hypothetical protein